jgi:hypothetical protein
MPKQEHTAQITVGEVTVTLPRTLTRSPDRSVDSAAAVYEGHGVTVIVDTGPFADRLDSHVGAPGYAESTQDVAGRIARHVTYTDPTDGTRTVAVHVGAPSPATVVVRTDLSVPPETAQQIIDSVQWDAPARRGGGRRGHSEDPNRSGDRGEAAVDADRRPGQER